MRLRFRNSLTQASILPMVLVISGLLGLALIAYLTFVSTQHTLTVRSGSWNGALVMSESGVEEALSHLNFSGTTNLMSAGWTLSGDAYRKTRPLPDGYFDVAISASLPPVISSTGFIQAPVQSSYISRAVQVVTTNVARFRGVIAKDSVKMSGGSMIDSFDSSDPAHSTGGHYDSAKAGDDAFVAVLSSVKKALDLEEVYGHVATGPGGTIAVTDGVGTRTWVAAHHGQIEPGYATDDFNMSILDVQPPFTSGFQTPVSGTVSGTNYLFVLDSGKYELSSCTVPGGQKMIVTGNATFYVTGDFTTSGSGYVWLAPGATLSLYIGGKGTISGGGIVNGAEKASSLAIYGLPGCTRVDYSGSAHFIGTVYAPEAKFTLSGGANASGAFVAESVSMSGSAQIHCDSALYGGNGLGKYVIISWNEL